MRTAPGSDGLPQESNPRKVRADALAVLIMGIAAAASVLALAVRKYLSTFTREGIVWDLPVKAQTGTARGIVSYRAEAAPDAPAVQGTFTHLQVVVPDVNAVSTACLALAIAAAALTGLVIIACTVRLARLFQQGRFFTLQTSRALRTITWTAFGGGITAFVGWNLGSNGIEGALGVRAAETGSFDWWGWYLIILFAVTAFGLVDIALRRAIRLERETEGLV